jgi:hypothetical protein
LHGNNQIGEHEKGYSYFLSSKSKDLDKIKQKYVLFIRENMYGNYNNDELSVSCFWTKRYEEGYNYLLEIIDDDRFVNQKDRLLDNKKHFQDNFNF